MKYNVLKYNYIDLNRIKYGHPVKEENDSEYCCSKCQYELTPEYSIPLIFESPRLKVLDDLSNITEPSIINFGIDKKDKTFINFKDKIQLIIVRPTSVFGDGGKNLVKIVNSLIYKPRIKNIIPIMINKYRKMHLVPVNDVVAAIYYLVTIDIDLSGEKFIISQDNHLGNNYFRIVNNVASKIGHKRYSKLFLPFSSLILVSILKLIGRSQLRPDQVYSSKKLYDYGFKSDTDLLEAIDKFVLSQI